MKHGQAGRISNSALPITAGCSYSSCYTTTAPGKSSKASYLRTIQQYPLNRLFITFGHPWLADSGKIQKACAWYLAYARPTKDEARSLITTLNGFTASACYLAEWNVLVNRMQAFFSVQEKELRQLLDYEKSMEQERRERTEHLTAEGTAYCMTIGSGEIYGLIRPQIEALYRVMNRFIEREKAPFPCRIKDGGEYGVCISKNIALYADRDEFYVSYSLGALEPGADDMPAGQIQKLAGILSDFLNTFGEGGEKKGCQDITDCPVESQSGIAFEIKEDGRQPAFRTTPWVSKRVYKEENTETETVYYIDVNEIHSPGLSFSEFVAIYRKLDVFLRSLPESAGIVCE